MTLKANDVPVYSGEPLQEARKLGLEMIADQIGLGVQYSKDDLKLKPDGTLGKKALNVLVSLLVDRVNRDPNTNLPNYTSFSKSLERVIKERKKFKNSRDDASSHDSTTHDSILFLDMNYMKTFNDELNSRVTDKVIAALSEEIHNFFRKDTLGESNSNGKAHTRTPCSDVVARANRGGDEFLVLLRGCDRDTAKKRAEELFNKIKEKVFVVPFEKNRKKKAVIIENVSLSFGFYELDSQNKISPISSSPKTIPDDTPEMAISRAEELMKNRKAARKKDGRITPPTFNTVKLEDLHSELQGIKTNDVIFIPEEEKKRSR